ncbi:hypothetical protein CEE34_02195 [Candidatus Aerophobetes bacterium Ae_b3a]|nr:MAG: hypothetical protein CEE34_02195 [Candidatus Aerophobetes bacterium Ae_b3a]
MLFQKKLRLWHTVNRRNEMNKMQVKAINMKEPGKIMFRDVDLGKLKPNEILVRTKACGICKFDINAFSGKIKDSYLDEPGHEGVGIIEEVGEEVGELKPGDKVAALGRGAFGNYFKASKNMVAKIPQETEDFEYWMAEPVACVVNGLRSTIIQPGDTVAIIGCGYMGLLLTQGLPKEYITHLFCIDINDERLELAKEFGADTILNSIQTDAVEYIKSEKGEVDVVIEAAGAQGTSDIATELLRKGGKLIIFGHHVEKELVDMGAWHMKGLRILNPSPMLSSDFSKDFQDAVKLMKRGTFAQKKLITHTFAFLEIQKAFSFVSSKPPHYIKGVILY